MSGTVLRCHLPQGAVGLFRLLDFIFTRVCRVREGSGYCIIDSTYIYCNAANLRHI